MHALMHARDHTGYLKNNCAHGHMLMKVASALISPIS
jgi:hypothetical protein